MREEDQEDDDYPDDFEDYVSETSRPATAHRGKDTPRDGNCQEKVAQNPRAVAKSAFDLKIRSIKLPLDIFPPKTGLLQPETPRDGYTYRPNGPPSHRPSAPPIHCPQTSPHHRLNDAPIHRPTEPPNYRLVSTPRYRPSQQPRHRPLGPPAHQPADLKTTAITKKKVPRHVSAWSVSTCTRALDLDLVDAEDDVVAREPASANKSAILLVLGLSKSGLC